MTRFVKIAAVVVVALVAVFVIAAGTLFGWRALIGPRARSLTDRRFERTQARLERGRYLVEGVMGCLFCHSPRDTNAPGNPPLAGKLGAGKVLTFLPPEVGRVVAANLTPDHETGIGSLSDDQIARSIREGITRDGRAMFPMMPYQSYRDMTDEDLASVVVYLRSLRPVRNPLPRTELAFPIKYIVRNLPMPVEQPMPDQHIRSAVERGVYLVKMGGCADCHTSRDERRAPLPGLEFAGGNVMQEEFTPATTANITPDASGIGSYDEAKFRSVMKTGSNGSRPLHSLMPYAVYRNMTDEDLGAMFAYLRTVKPVKHWVSSAAKGSFCPICNKQHGYGEMNQTGDAAPNPS